MPSFSGDDNANTLNGSEGKDTIRGNGGNDTLNGLGGEDIIFGGTGDDRIDGGTGSDYIYGDVGRDIINGGEGGDYLYATGYGISYNGYGVGELDELRGGTGYDYLVGDAFVHYDGGADNDTARIHSVYQAAAVTFSYGGDGTTYQIYVGGARAGTVRDVSQVVFEGSAFNDIVSLAGAPPGGGHGLEGRDGDDVLTGSLGNDALVGGAGTDLLRGGAGDDGLAANESLKPGGEYDRLWGEDGDDSMVGDSFVHYDGGSGRDSLQLHVFDQKAGVALDYGGVAGTTYTIYVGGVAAGSVRDIEGMQFYGSAFGDVMRISSIAYNYLTLYGNAGNDVLVGGIGNDGIYGGDDADALDGQSGNDRLEGGAGDDVLLGGAGNDMLVAGAGTDALIGGLGDDQFTVDARDVIYENAGEGTETVTTTGNFYLFANLERMVLHSSAGDAFGVGNNLDNSITGNGSANLLLGGGGKDTIAGGAGDDRVYGEAGDDVITGGDGIDYLIGGSGGDDLFGESGSDALYGEDGDDDLGAGAGFFTDILSGGAGSDSLYAYTGLGDHDILDGGSGDDSYTVDTPYDVIYEAAGGGNDTVFVYIVGTGYYLWDNVENLYLSGETPFGVGNGLANRINGNASANWLLGGGGDDILNGEAGADVLFGEGGADTFVFWRGSGADAIADFQDGVDRINLSAFGYASFAQLAGAIKESGGSAYIDLGNGDLVVVNGIAAASLSAADFIFTM